MTENSLNLLKKNYFRSNESNWSNLCKRVSRSIANAEEVNSADWEQKFYHMMNNMDFVPSSPCLMNAGTKNQQLSSCFIISIDDNIESIYNAKAEMAKIFQKNGGVGFNISALRPAKSVVQTSKGYSCGAIGFMEEFDLTADIITRNNARKGAIKVDLNDWHPDIFEFVSCKDSLNKFNRMNISVSMSDKFMNAVKNNSDWELKFPDYENMDKELYHSKWHGDMDLWEESGYPVKIYQTVKAKELYNIIMEHAWKTGEPGVSFRDVMDKDNPNPHMGKIDSTNPCFTGDMRLLTENGYKTFEELCDTQFNVVNKDNNIVPSKVWCSGEKEVIELTLSNDTKIKCTPNHIFMLADGSECEAQNLLNLRLKRFNDFEKNIYVTKITSIGVQKVYDFTEPVTHWGIVEDRIVHNCAEFCSIPYNSCLSGDTLLSTPNGVKKIKDIVDTNTKVLSSDGVFRTPENIIYKGEKSTYTIKLYGGLSLTCTKDHKLLTNNGWKELQDIDILQDKIKIGHQYPYMKDDYFDPLYMMYGWQHGDGWYNSTIGITFNYPDGDKEAKDLLLPLFIKDFDISCSPLKDDEISYQIQTAKTSSMNKAKELGFFEGKTLDKKLPSTFYEWNINQQLSFIRGLFSADAGVGMPTKNGIFFASSSYNLVDDVQKFLSTIGIECHVTEMSSEGRNHPQYRLAITNESARVYMSSIAFIHPSKNNKFNGFKAQKQYKDRDFEKIISIEPTNKVESVYDVVNLSPNNSFIANGIIVHNCNLGSINLSNFVENKQINYDKLEETVHNAVRFLDDMITVNVLPIDKINKVTKSVRSIGLGTMGFADMLYKLNIIYGSLECNSLIDSLYSFIKNEAQKESIKLAKEKGTYAAYKGSKWDKNNILVRNSNFISIAPNGSISFITNTSGGIEPNFALVYTRLTNDGTKYFVVNPVLEEWLKQHDMYDDTILNKIVENNGKRINEIPEYFLTAQDISPNIHVDVVSQVQKYVDLSVSKTVNLPNNANVNDVSDIYMNAWENGIKGITIYRDGSRENQTLSTSTNNNKEEIQKVKKEEIPRGVIIDADDNVIGLKRKLTTGCGSLHCEAFFDPVSGDLLETYFNKGSTGGCVSGDTEYFNGKEWKPISQYIKGEKVLQYNKDGTANLVEPLNYIVNDNVKTLKHFTNKYFEMMLSNDHRMYLYTNYRKYDMGIRKELHDEIITVDDWINNGKKERHVPTTFKLYGNGIQLTDEEIRVCVMVYADGHICNKQSQYISVEVSKDRKKKRTRELLKNANIPYKEFEYDYKPNYISFKFYPTDRLLNWISDKQFTSKWYQANKHQMEIIADEIMYWDGSVGKGNRIGEYYSSKKEEIDFIQFILAALGYRGVISYNGKKTSYRVRVTNLSNLDISHTTIKDEPTLDNKSYCFTVPSSMLVLRYKNNIFITGNCNQFMIGLSRTISLLCRAGVDINTIIEQLNSCGVCPSYATRTSTKHDTSKGACCPMAIGNALLDMYNEMQDRLFDNDSEQIDVVKTTKPKSLCPECGEPLIFEGGCNICKSCGWSKCN